MNVREIAERVAALRENEQLGASQLAREAVELLAEMALDPHLAADGFPRLFRDTARELAHARPSMASPLNAAGAVMAAWLEAGGEGNVGGARAAAGEAARRWLAAQELSRAIIAGHTAEAISGTAITLSFSSTVLQALEECWSRGVLGEVIVAEARPLCEGRRTAEVLAARGIPTTLISDAQMGLFTSEAAVALVGADTLRPNGSLVNKAGTLLLALAARRCRIPFYSLAETHKIAPSVGRWRTPSLEEQSAAELLPEAIPGVTVRNVYFDLTPARLLTGYITEKGLLNRQDIVALAREAPGALLASGS